MLGAVVVGIDNTNTGKLYRVISFKYKDTEKGEGYHSWEFKCEMLNEDMIKNAIKKYGESFFLNIGINGDGKITGKSSALSRFDAEKTGHHPIVIIAQYQTKDGRVIGYSTGTYDGKVRNISLKEMIAYGERCSKAGLVPVQNAIFVPAEGDKRGYFKSYPNMPFIISLHDTGKNKYAEVRRSNTKQNEKDLKKIDEIFTKEQIKELALGKQQGVDYKVYAIPALTPLQMKTLREGMLKGVNVRPFAYPEYKAIAMMYYIDCIENGIDIKQFLSPKYNAQQLFQLAYASEMGLNISKICNPKLGANDMAEIIVRLEQNTWKDQLVKKDGSWR